MRRDLAFLATLIAILVGVIAIPTHTNRVSTFDAERQSTPPDTTTTSTSTSSTTTTTEAAPAPTAAPEPAPAPAAPTAVVATEVAVQVVPDGCDGTDWVIPVQYVYRESKCTFGAVSPGGQYVGAYQFDVRHWIPADQGGWGGCADLGDWNDPANQHECARRLSRDGTYLAPWGG